MKFSRKSEKQVYFSFKSSVSFIKPSRRFGAQKTRRNWFRVNKVQNYHFFFFENKDARKIFPGFFPSNEKKHGGQKKSHTLVPARVIAAISIVRPWH